MVNEVNGEFGESIEFANVSVNVNLKCKKGQKVKRSKVTFLKKTKGRCLALVYSG